MVELNHCWVQFTPYWVEFLRFTSFTFLQCTYRWSHHQPQDNPPIWLFPHRSRDHPPLPHMTSPPLTPPLYIPFPYSSLQFFSTSSLLPLSPHLSQDHPPVTRPPTQMTIPPLTLPLYISFYTPLYSSLPPLWPALFWQSNSILFLYLLSTQSTHPLSTSPLYILNIVGYCHETAQSQLGCPTVTRHPPTPYDFYIYNGTAQLPLGSPLVTDNPSPILTPNYTSL